MQLIIINIRIGTNFNIVEVGFVWCKISWGGEDVIKVISWLLVCMIMIFCIFDLVAILIYTVKSVIKNIMSDCYRETHTA